MRRGSAGAEGMSFDTIVASGVRSALPHGRATSGEVAEARVRDAGFRCYSRRILRAI